MIEIIIKQNDENQTIIRFLKKVIDYKTGNINLYKLLRTKKIRINDKVIKDSQFKLNCDDIVKIYHNVILIQTRDKVIKTDEKFEVAYEDENLLIAVKNFNILVHNSHGDSLDNMVKNYLINKNEYEINDYQSFVISHIHRLDKLTKGLVIYAKNKKTLDYFLEKIKEPDSINKFYLLECEGHLKSDNIEIEGRIYKNIDNEKMAFTTKKIKHGKNAKTILKLVEKRKKSSIFEAKLITGRKNQIRATMEFLKHPIINDTKYSAKKVNDDRWINLFAYKLEFNNLDNGFEYLNNKIIQIKIKFN